MVTAWVACLDYIGVVYYAILTLFLCHIVMRYIYIPVHVPIRLHISRKKYYVLPTLAWFLLERNIIV